MPREPLNSESRVARPFKRQVSTVRLFLLIAVFGVAMGVFVVLGVMWTRQLRIDTYYNVHTDGLRISVWLAWIAAALTFVATTAAVGELIRRRRSMIPGKQ